MALPTHTGDRDCPARGGLPARRLLGAALFVAGWLAAGDAAAVMTPVTASAIATVSITSATPQVQEDIKSPGAFVLSRSAGETLRLPAGADAGYLSGPLAPLNTPLHKGDAIAYVVFSAGDVLSANATTPYPDNTTKTVSKIVMPVDGTLTSYVAAVNSVVSPNSTIAKFDNSQHYLDAPLQVSYSTTGTYSIIVPPVGAANAYLSGPMATQGDSLHRGDVIGYLVTDSTQVIAANGHLPACYVANPSSCTTFNPIAVITMPVNGTVTLLRKFPGALLATGDAIGTYSKDPIQDLDVPNLGALPILNAHVTNPLPAHQAASKATVNGYLSGPTLATGTQVSSNTVVAYVVPTLNEARDASGQCLNTASCTSSRQATATAPVTGYVSGPLMAPDPTTNVGSQTVVAYIVGSSSEVLAANAALPACYINKTTPCSFDPAAVITIPAGSALVSRDNAGQQVNFGDTVATYNTFLYTGTITIPAGSTLESYAAAPGATVTVGDTVAEYTGSYFSGPFPKLNTVLSPVIKAPAAGYFSGPFAAAGTPFGGTTTVAYIVADPSQVQPANGAPPVSYTAAVTLPAGSTLNNLIPAPGDSVTAGETLGAYSATTAVPIDVAYVVADPSEVLAADAALPACYLNNTSPCSFNPIDTITVPSQSVLVNIATPGASVQGGDTVAVYRASGYLSGPFKPLNSSSPVATNVAYIVTDPTQALAADAALPACYVNQTSPCSFNPIASLAVPANSTVLSFTGQPGSPANPGDRLGTYEDITGTAAAGVDFVPMSGTAIFPIGAKTITVEMIPSEDGDPASGNESLTVSLAAGGDYAVDASAASADIILTEPPTVTVTSTPSTLINNAGQAVMQPGSFTFTRSGDVTGDMTIDFTLGGTAVAASDCNSGDYCLSGATLSTSGTATPQYTVTIPAGADSATVQVNAHANGTSVKTVTLATMSLPLKVPGNAPDPGYLSGPLVRPVSVGKPAAYIVGSPSEVVAATGDLCALPQDPPLLTPCPADEIGVPMPQFGSGAAGMVTGVTMLAQVGDKVSPGETIAQLSVEQAAALVIARTLVSPAVTIVPNQGSGDRRLIVTGGGPVTARAVVTDANPGDTDTYDWSGTDSALAPTAGTTGATFSFEPSGLNAGLYTLRVKVTDSSGLSTTANLLIKVLDQPPALDHDTGSPELEVTQGITNPQQVASSGGDVNVSVSDLDPTQTYSFDWSHTDAALSPPADSTSSSFDFDPSGLAAGTYTASVKVTAAGGAITTVVRDIQVGSTAGGAHDNTEIDDVQDSDGDGVPDATEGYTDANNNGIPDYLDASTLPPNMLQEVPLVADQFLIMTEPELALSLGNIAFAAGNDGADITAQDIATYGGAGAGADAAAPGTDSDCSATTAVQDCAESDSEPDGDRDDSGSDSANEADYDADSSVDAPFVDFNVSGLPQAGMSANVVITQQNALPANPRYRIYHPGGGWKDFAIDANNQVASCCGQASLDQYNSGKNLTPGYGNTGNYPGSNGSCPPAGSASYQPGLREGAMCVQLTIQDGGPNDTDGTANHVITDPAVVTGTAASGGGSGGGVVNGATLAALAGLSLVGAARRRRAARRN